MLHLKNFLSQYQRIYILTMYSKYIRILWNMCGSLHLDVSSIFHKNTWPICYKIPLFCNQLLKTRATTNNSLYTDFSNTFNKKKYSFFPQINLIFITIYKNKCSYKNLSNKLNKSFIIL